jgi:hypothetical protein
MRVSAYLHWDDLHTALVGEPFKFEPDEVDAINPLVLVEKLLGVDRPDITRVECYRAIPYVEEEAQREKVQKRLSAWRNRVQRIDSQRIRVTLLGANERNEVKGREMLLALNAVRRARAAGTTILILADSVDLLPAVEHIAMLIGPGRVITASASSDGLRRGARLADVPHFALTERLVTEAIRGSRDDIPEPRDPHEPVRRQTRP